MKKITEEEFNEFCEKYKHPFSYGMKVLKFLFPTFNITKEIYWVRTIPTIVIISFIKELNKR